MKEFKEKKDLAVKRYNKIKQKMDEEVKYLETKQQERMELADKQHELELRNGMEMIKAETQKKLSRDVNLKFLILCTRFQPQILLLS